MVLIDINNKVCNTCPRSCNVYRSEHLGYCKVDSNPLVSAVVCHMGEEPVLVGNTGICNVFFAHCNLQCVYCQNHQISRNNSRSGNWITDYDEIVNKVISILKNGSKLLGFVTPTHQVPQMLEIVKRVNALGYYPRVVYNTNCYESVETLRELEEVVDIYLPDFKYINNQLGQQYSNVPNYFDVAFKALKEMVRQKGTTLLLDDDGVAEFGLIVRHLVLPGYQNESVKLLKFLADEFSPRLHISLMSQYSPPIGLTLPEPINRCLTREEYEIVANTVEEIGFRGWMQDVESQKTYVPDFEKGNPF